MFLWQFFIPMIICVIAYWRILVAIRRQSSVMPTSRRNITAKPVAGPSNEPREGNDGSTSDKSGRDKAASKGKARTAANQSNATGFSKAKINVIRTMIFISVCFVVCLMPYDTYFLIRSFTVFIYLFIFIVTLYKITSSVRIIA